MEILQELRPTMRIVRPHPFKNWFMSRGLSLRQLAALVDINTPSLTHYLNGVLPLPERIYKQLQEFKAEITKWEMENKKSWRSLYGKN